LSIFRDLPGKAYLDIIGFCEMVEAEGGGAALDMSDKEEELPDGKLLESDDEDFDEIW